MHSQDCNSVKLPVLKNIFTDKIKNVSDTNEAISVESKAQRSYQHSSVEATMDFSKRSWKEECAVFGIWDDPEASHMTYLGLFAQQHRGQEAAGIVTLTEEGQHLRQKGPGLVGEVFSEQDLKNLKGRCAVGHVRYSTTGNNDTHNIQPLTASLLNGPLAVAHNGNIVNERSIRNQLKQEGSIFQGTSDTEVLLHLLSKDPRNDLFECMKSSLQKLDGAFSFVVLSKDSMVIARDPRGFRPLVLGRRPHEQGQSWVVASETCAFDLIGAEFVREVEPGEIISISKEGFVSEFYSENKKYAQCIFEHVYFARPDSNVFGLSVYKSRKEFGRALAKENPVQADLVIPVPDSGIAAALGYSEESGIPFDLGIIRNHYIGRTFIQPTQSIRSFGVKIKLNPQSDVLKGKRVIVIDDSLVRGTTSKKIIRLVRQAGAKEVHFRVACPPTISPCYYGVDTPEKDQLIASKHSVDQIQEYIEADTLGYLSHEGMMKAVDSAPRGGFCSACFTADYPAGLPEA
ncbi:MAG: amidophosphoribosyltransferase [Bdellovibrionaceae bacterium]|nr:amidophosphoribosyltransferase [Pseudobdellovibrionaceae bacterium]